MTTFHEAIVYVDESGDHGPTSPTYPVFVLAFCVFDKIAYAEEVTTSITKFKFRYFGHDAVHLHEREIRLAKPPFDILKDPATRHAFMDDISTIIAEAPLKIIAIVVRKDDPRNLYKRILNPDTYHAAMMVGVAHMEEALQLRSKAKHALFVFEQRSPRHDLNLEREFRLQGGGKLPTEIAFAPKGNYAGLELADLVARPIGIHVLRPHQSNRAWDIIKTKLWDGPGREGLTVIGQAPT